MSFYRGGEKVKINGREAIVIMDNGVWVYTIDPNEKEFSGIDYFDKSKVDIERLEGNKHEV